MFGFGKPRWSVEIRHAKTGEAYKLESDSIGKLLGYLSIPLEEGRRPSIQWVVAIRHKSLKVFRLWPNWPDDQKPVEQLFANAVAIDPKLVRAKPEPRFYRTDRGKKERLSLDAEIGGVSVHRIPIEDRIRLHQEGRESSMSVHSLIDRVFDDKYDPDRGDEIAMIKIDP
tara:strand:+ start:1290 stop:1799 length:510 start_codon:yes stop_codon:yes gene_type:complete